MFLSVLEAFVYVYSECSSFVSRTRAIRFEMCGSPRSVRGGSRGCITPIDSDFPHCLDEQPNPLLAVLYMRHLEYRTGRHLRLQVSITAKRARDLFSGFTGAGASIKCVSCKSKGGGCDASQQWGSVSVSGHFPPSDLTAPPMPKLGSGILLAGNSSFLHDFHHESCLCDGSILVLGFRGE